MSRTTITLNEELQSRLRRYTPVRGMNQFIAQAIEEKVASLERSEIEANMREGYLAEDRDHSDLLADWSVIDGEGWPD